MPDLDTLAADLGRRFATLDCRLGLQVVAVDSGRPLAWRADARFAMASVVKVLVRWSCSRRSRPGNWAPLSR